ncbi:DUF1850 domain-containing protein [Calderihabitans maritimus]|uniref:DUF1850 domain-containing protein n=1 Tax=Calderihabitans maritimus TaxID=1246530 RepID=A0A1Z5HPX7_9FIRM|nr:DUF1850 domain-containing protein [Calderihabitans maritimus]GAW91583.1 hypothetical protein KKC1_07440 [Calderihabitans maritimus]
MKKIIVFLLAILGVTVVFLPIIPVLTVYDQHSNNVLLAFRLENNTFSVRWIHSVELEPWQETFQLRKGRLVLQETRFKAYGAGMPTNGKEEIFVENGWIIIRGINRTYDSLPISISKVSGYQLISGEKVVNLNDWTIDGQKIVIKGNRVGLWSLIYP